MRIFMGHWRVLFFRIDLHMLPWEAEDTAGPGLSEKHNSTKESLVQQLHLSAPQFRDDASSVPSPYLQINTTHPMQSGLVLLLPLDPACIVTCFHQWDAAE